MQRILFQGDSITDAGRARDFDPDKGEGYPTLVSAELGFENPGEYEFINRGIGGNRITDLLARIKSDTINLKPDVLSILIGINDVWHEFDACNGVDADLYETVYSIIIEQIKKNLPNIKIMILEPFVLCDTATEENWTAFRSETEKRAAAAKRIAEKYGLKFIPLMKKFDEAAASHPDQTWLRDGVHPSSAGHELIKREWLKAFKEL